LRGVLRQLIAISAVQVDGSSFNTLQLTDLSRSVLKGDLPVLIRESVSSVADKKTKRSNEIAPAMSALDSAGQARYGALKAWRAEVARQHNLPAYVIFHDTTLAAIAERRPQSLDDLKGISGIGAKKLQAYAAEVLRVVSL
jgi:ATP-dependent DNA helicase RecQ